jgi:DNA-binding transcriptional LysR family regulator
MPMNATRAESRLVDGTLPCGRRRLRILDTIRRLDLTLLLVFAEAMRTRKLGAVADRLGLTPSGVSHALARLRDIFPDPLFLRHSTGVRPTPRAIAMLDDVTAAIAALSRTVERSDFDPASIRRVFRIAALDFGVTMLAPHLIERSWRCTRRRRCAAWRTARSTSPSPCSRRRRPASSGACSPRRAS